MGGICVLGSRATVGAPASGRSRGAHEAMTVAMANTNNARPSKLFVRGALSLAGDGMWAWGEREDIASAQKPPQLGRQGDGSATSIKRDQSGPRRNQSLVRERVRDEILEGDHARSHFAEAGAHANEVVVAGRGVITRRQLGDGEG